MDYTVIIPAAGVGKRMGAGKNKLFITLQETPILVHTLRVFENDEWCKAIILVINEDDRNEINDLLVQYPIKKMQAIVAGGKERQESVFLGLKAITNQVDIVLVHDGARPFVKEKYIHNLVVRAEDDGAAVLAVPVKDTIKRVKEGIVNETVDRSELWSIQTPQAFQFKILKEAHEKAIQSNYLGTDDASLLERQGQKVVIIEGHYDNIKMTTKEDLVFAEAILSNRNEDLALFNDLNLN